MRLDDESTARTPGGEGKRSSRPKNQPKARSQDSRRGGENRSGKRGGQRGGGSSVGTFTSKPEPAAPNAFAKAFAAMKTKPKEGK